MFSFSFFITEPVGYTDGEPFENAVDKSLPPYLMSGSPGEAFYREDNPSGYKPPVSQLQ